MFEVDETAPRHFGTYTNAREIGIVCDPGDMACVGTLPDQLAHVDGTGEEEVRDGLWSVGTSSVFGGHGDS